MDMFPDEKAAVAWFESAFWPDGERHCGKRGIQESGTLAQMRDTVARLVGRGLLYRDLIADNGPSSGARS